MTLIRWTVGSLATVAALALAYCVWFARAVDAATTWGEQR